MALHYTTLLVVVDGRRKADSTGLNLTCNV